MANGARFSCAELAELDRRIAEAADRAAARERAVFAHLLAAALAGERGAGRPAPPRWPGSTWRSPPPRWPSPAPGAARKSTEDAAFRVEAGRHPVVEAALAGEHAFVPNDAICRRTGGCCC